MRRDRVLQVWMGERKVGTLAETPEHLDTIFQMGGSSGGARPKIYYELDGEEWIVVSCFRGQARYRRAGVPLFPVCEKLRH